MRERPILFSGEMVRAILDGRKTQTRRAVKLSHGRTIEGGPIVEGSFDWYQVASRDGLIANYSRGVLLGQCPYGVPGDRLWVRESFWCVDSPFFECAQYLYADEFEEYSKDSFDEYETGNSWAHEQGESFWNARTCGLRHGHIPSIHMPRWASRLTLEITEVRVERLQEITADDCFAEGHPARPEVSDDPQVHRDAARDWYMDLWDSLNAKRAFGWITNPWVWVLSFKRVDAPLAETGGKVIDLMEALTTSPAKEKASAR